MNDEYSAYTACELNAIRNVLQVNRGLVHSKLFGYEGSDVFEVIKNVSTLAKERAQHPH